MISRPFAKLRETPVLAQLPPVREAAGLNLAHVLDDAGARALLAAGGADKEALKAALTDLETILPVTIQWLGDRGVELDNWATEFIRHMWLRSKDTRRSESLTPNQARARRYKLERRKLPPATEWRSLFRSLRAIVLIQSGASAEAAALQSHFADKAALSDACRALYGCSPTVAKRTLGIDWFLWQWWSRRGGV